MPIIEIALSNPDKNPMWNIPGTKLFLSYESPGPLEVNTDELSVNNRRILAQDISSRVLVSKNADQFLTPDILNVSNVPIKGGNSLAKSYANGLRVVKNYDEGFQVVTKEKQPEVVAPVVVPQVVALDVIEQRKHALQEVLDQHVATVKKQLAGKPLAELRILKQLEKDGKNRPSVIKLIDALVSKAQVEVFQSIQKSFDSKAKSDSPKDLPKKYWDNVGNVIESDYEEVTIKLGTDED